MRKPEEMKMENTSEFTAEEANDIYNEMFPPKNLLPDSPACSCGWNGPVDWKAKGQKCPNCGKDLT